VACAFWNHVLSLRGDNADEVKMKEKVRRRLVDLSVPLMNESMEPSAFVPQITYMTPAAAARQMAKRYGISIDNFPDSVGLAQEWVTLSVHSGTHVDAPSHYGPRTDGVRPMAIDEVPLEWCYGSGVLLDFSDKKPGDLISESDIAAALKGIDHELRPLEIVLLRTDASKRFYDPDFENLQPGLSRGGCAYILDRGVKVIGIDAGSMDVPTSIMIERLKEGDRSQLFQAHFLGREREYLQLEKLANLDVLPPTGFTIFLFPVMIQGAGAGWTRAVALLDP
jgi:kynurenine formamidase